MFEQLTPSQLIIYIAKSDSLSVNIDCVSSLSWRFSTSSGMINKVVGGADTSSN